MIRALTLAPPLLAMLAALAFAPCASADTIKIGVYSQKISDAHASAGAEVEVTSGGQGQPARASETRGATSVAIAVTAPEGSSHSYPALPSTSPLLADPTPLGAGTFWYSDGSSHACVYQAASSPLCYIVTSSGGGARVPALSPAAIAAAAADRLDLVPGRIEVSPRRKGLTGAESWFWLSPAAETREVSVSVAGVTVTVVAAPSVEWRFGDGSSFSGGSGVPYRTGAPPDEAVRHVYETRCLPGDRGRNPYVLASCRDEGYRVEALVHWRISYRASGRIDESGVLPARTTETAIDYPVTEARAFLTRGAGA